MRTSAGALWASIGVLDSSHKIIIGLEVPLDPEVQDLT